jgi:hypothetical protein
MQRSRVITVLAFLLVCYLGSYLLLTLRGRYEPVTIGLNGANAYAWAPENFTHDFRWDRFKIAFYLPLYCLDAQFWHTRAAVRTGRYPMDVPPKLVRTEVNSKAPPANLPIPGQGR